MLELHRGVDRAHRRNGAAPELRARQYVRFVHRAQPPRAVLRARVSKRGDALDLRRRIGLRIPCALYALFGDVPALAKIHSPREFTHNLEIQIPEAIRLQGRDSSQRLEQFHGTNVDVEPQPFAKIEQSTLRALPDG